VNGGTAITVQLLLGALWVGTASASSLGDLITASHVDTIVAWAALSLVAKVVAHWVGLAGADIGWLGRCRCTGKEYGQITMILLT
jgi:hypothetical protein